MLALCVKLRVLAMPLQFTVHKHHALQTRFIRLRIGTSGVNAVNYWTSSSTKSRELIYVCTATRFSKWTPRSTELLSDNTITTPKQLSGVLYTTYY